MSDPLLVAAWNFLEWGGRTSVELRMVPLEMVQPLRGCQISRHSCLNMVCAGLKQCEVLRPVLLSPGLVDGSAGRSGAVRAMC